MLLCPFVKLWQSQIEDFVRRHFPSPCYFEATIEKRLESEAIKKPLMIKQAF